jgi:hypothetical protein
VPERVAITLPVEDGLAAADYVGLAELAERCGYDAVLAGKVAGPEVFSLLGMIGGPETVADYVRALRSAGIDLPLVLTPGAEPGDVAGSRATITAVATALGLSA